MGFKATTPHRFLFDCIVHGTRKKYEAVIWRYDSTSIATSSGGMVEFTYHQCWGEGPGFAPSFRGPVTGLSAMTALEASEYRFQSVQHELLGGRCRPCPPTRLFFLFFLLYRVNQAQAIYV